MKTLIAGSLALTIALSWPPAATAELPDDSVYQLSGQWRDHKGQALVLADLAGRPRLLSFVYTYCEHTCPTIVARLKLVSELPGNPDADDLQVTLVSLDPERDTPERMRAYMAQQGLDQRDWLLLHGDPVDVLGFAAMLGVRYRPMGDSDIAHSNMITVLDADGVVRYQSKGLDEDPAGLAAAIVAVNEPEKVE